MKLVEEQVLVTSGARRLHPADVKLEWRDLVFAAMMKEMLSARVMARFLSEKAKEIGNQVPDPGSETC